MRFNHPAAIVIASLCLVATISAQQKPNFSGHWVAVSPADAAGQEQFVKHDATSLATSHESEGDPHRETYKLDGSESRNVLTSHGAEIVTLSKAEWTGNQLTITSSTVYPDGRKLAQKETWSMDAEARLVIAFTQTMAGQPEMSMKMIYKKQ